MQTRLARTAVPASPLFLLLVALAIPGYSQDAADSNEMRNESARVTQDSTKSGVPSKTRTTENSLELTPAKLTEPEVTIELPAAFDSVRVGGGGRYLIFHFKSLNKLAVLDVCKLKIAGYIATKDDDVLYAASASQLILIHPGTATMESYSLETLKLQRTRSLSFEGKLKVVAIGSASEGPLLVSPVRNDRFAAVTALLDLETLKPLDEKWRHFAGAARGQVTHARAAARGNVFAWSAYDRGVNHGQVLFCEGLNVKAFQGQSGDIYPDECGERLYFSGKMADRQLHPVPLLPGQDWQGYRVPAVHGPLYVRLPCDYHSQPAVSPLKSAITVHLPGEISPLATFADVPFRPYNGGDFARDNLLPVADQVFLIPGAQVLAIVPETKDRIVFRRFDLDQALKSWGKDYLFVMSAPPHYVRAGDTLQYQFDVKSSRPPIKYRLDAGPEGMTVSPEGLLRWLVNPVGKSAASVIISVEDGSGKSIFHTFDLVVRGAGRAEPAKIAAAQGGRGPGRDQRFRARRGSRHSAVDARETCSRRSDLPLARACHECLHRWQRPISAASSAIAGEAGRVRCMRRKDRRLCAGRPR